MFTDALSHLQYVVELILNIFLVREKFSIQEGKSLTVTDDGGTEVDADVFPELVSKDVCLVIHDSDSEGMLCCGLNCDTIAVKTISKRNCGEFVYLIACMRNGIFFFSFSFC